MSAQKGPFVKTEQVGEVWLCQCGQSKNAPYCDGSHKGSGTSPKMVKVEKDGVVAWCSCKQSKNYPYCDGSHNKI